VNKKWVHRIHREEGLMLMTQRRRKRASHLRMLPPSADQTMRSLKYGFCGG